MQRRSFLRASPIAALASLGLLSGCDGAFTRTLELAVGTKSEAADMYRLFILGDTSGLKKLMDAAIEKPAFAFYAGLGNDSASSQRNLANDRAALTFYESAKTAYPNARFNQCLVKQRLGIKDGLEEDYLFLCKQYMQPAMVAYAAYKEKADPQAAAYWYEKALGEGNYPWANLRLGRMLVEGRGRNVNTEEALKLFRGAGEQGVVDALNDLAGTAPTPEERLDWKLRYLFGANMATIPRLEALRVTVDMDFKEFAEKADFARNWLHVHKVKPLIESALPHRNPMMTI